MAAEGNAKDFWNVVFCYSQVEPLDRCVTMTKRADETTKEMGNVAARGVNPRWQPQQKNTDNSSKASKLSKSPMAWEFPSSIEWGPRMQMDTS